MLGWKSKRIEDRIGKGFHNDKVLLMDFVFAQYKGSSKVDIDENLKFGKIDNIYIGEMVGMPHNPDTTILREIERTLPVEEKINNAEWKKLINCSRHKSERPTPAIKIKGALGISRVKV